MLLDHCYCPYICTILKYVHHFANIAKEYENLRDSEFAYVFVRKVTSENGMVLSFTYVGKGKLTNPRKQEKNQTYLFDIEMEEVLPDYLQYDFGLTRMN